MSSFSVTSSTNSETGAVCLISSALSVLVHPLIKSYLIIFFFLGECVLRFTCICIGFVLVIGSHFKLLSEVLL